MVDRNTPPAPGPERFRAITRSNVDKTPEWERLSPDLREAVRVVSAVLPFRVNEYVMRELIDWDQVPEDPMFQLTFPQRGMLKKQHFAAVRSLLDVDAPREEHDREIRRIRLELNPHPSGQMTHNVPIYNDEPVAGLQHKYRETVLFFPSHGQTCHAYCTFCFRWAQFVGMEEMKFASNDAEILAAYLKDHPLVTDVLFTGGDPLIMGTKALRRYLETLLDPELEHIQTIRIGTKAVAYWPQRFVSDGDADELMRLFEKVVAAGKHLAIMGHYSHPVELSTGIAEEAVRRIRSTGAIIRMQSPCIRHVNDDPLVWAEMWRAGTRLGCIPYYMFVERDTGASHYFELPLTRVWQIFRKAYSRVSGVARSVRGPCMSAFPGKVHILGVSEIGGEKVFVLEYLQARDPTLVRQPFFAKYSPGAVWYTDLEPFAERDRPFFPRIESYPLRRQGMVPLTVSAGESE